MRTKRKLRRDSEVIPRGHPNPRSLAQFRREVVVLLRASHRISGEKGIRLVASNNGYVRTAWSGGKAPCYVADNLARKEHGVVLSRRDPENPKEGEVYESRTTGNVWEIVGVDKEKRRVSMRKRASKDVGVLKWNPSVLKGMKQLHVKAAQLVKEAARVIEQESPPAPRGLFKGLFGGSSSANDTVATDPSGRAPLRRRRKKAAHRRTRR